jgi:hypothetical protein
MAHDVGATDDVGDDAEAAGRDAHAPQRLGLAAHRVGPRAGQTRALIGGHA